MAMSNGFSLGNLPLGKLPMGKWPLGGFPLGGGAKRRLIGFLACLILGVAGGVFMTGKVVSVADGDTLTFLTSGGETQKIRLYGVDSPELHQAGGQDAAEFARSLALFAKVQVTPIDTDQYGRSVSIVTLPDGRVLNEELVKNGQAWVYTAYCKTARCVYWKGLEAKARADRVGLWRNKKAIPPWQWRRRHSR